MYVGDVKTDEISIFHAGFYLTKRLRKLKWSFFFVSTHAQLRPHTERPAWQNSFWCISKISDPNRSMTKGNLVFVTWIQIFFLDSINDSYWIVVSCAGKFISTYLATARLSNLYHLVDMHRANMKFDYSPKKFRLLEIKTLYNHKIQIVSGEFC